MTQGKKKGGAYERKLCVELSRWWTAGAREDVFWRTAGSGARSTVREQKGQRTANQAGDICAIDPIGKPFLHAFSVECKRGYSRYTLADLFDAPNTAAKQMYELWFEQAEASRRQSYSLYWLVVAQRDRREAICLFPTEAYTALYDLGAFHPTSLPYILYRDVKRDVVGMRLTTFLEDCDPSYIKELVGA